MCPNTRLTTTAEAEPSDAAQENSVALAPFAELTGTRTDNPTVTAEWEPSGPANVTTDVLVP
jgi:hypothetical protein